MKILFLAPQPFYQERGTPIAVRLALGLLTEEQRHQIDLITYHEGEPLPLEGVRHIRIQIPRILKRWIVGIGPGISLKKLVCDVIFLITAFKVVYQNRGASQYQLTHAVEEAVFIAWLLKLCFGIPYLYDMDSSLAMQLAEKWWWLRPIRPVLEQFERIAIRGSEAVVPVCDALAVIAAKHGAKDQETVRDISLLELPNSHGRSSASDTPPNPIPNLRQEAGLAASSDIALYVGNLERYQGVDLLLESFRHIYFKTPNLHLVIIGGTKEHIAMYQDTAAKWGLQDRIVFLGPRPIAQLKSYLEQATILCSPRIKGNNTPMKIFSYLHSGRALLATELPTHQQVLDSSIAVMAKADPENFGAALADLALDSEKRSRLGAAAFTHADARYTYPVFKRSLSDLYQRIEERCIP